MLRILIICIVTFLYSTSIFGQTVLTNDGVVELVKTGLSAEIIIAKIKSSDSKFDTTTEGLKKLTEDQVPDSVVVAMIERESVQTQATKTESNESSKLSDSIPEQGSISDIKGKTKVYIFSEDLKSRDKIIKELEEKKLFEVVDKIDDSDFVIEFEVWEETVGATGNVYGNTATVTQKRVRIGVLTVLMPAFSGNGVRFIYSNKQTQKSFFIDHPAKKTTEKFLKEFEKLK